MTNTTPADIIQQYLDDYAEVLAGGKVYSYEGGTSTPLATYQDLEGLTANANPVILDASGRATIRLTDGVSYKLFVTDADDNEIFTLDDIIGGGVGAVPVATSTVYAIHMTYEGTPGASGFMGGVIVNDDVLLPIDLDGAFGAVQTNPGSSYVISVQKNDVEVGTATINTSGVYAFATTSHATVSLTVGDKLSFVGPGSAGIAADFTIYMEGAVQ